LGHRRRQDHHHARRCGHALRDHERRRRCGRPGHHRHGHRRRRPAYKDAASTDDKSLLNTKATARRGDYVVIEYGDANGWQVTRARGVWAKS
jgi:hypothetical protein